LSSRIESLPELVQLLELEAILYYGISIELNESPDAPAGPPIEPSNVDANYGIRIRHTPREMGVRLRGEFNVPSGRVVIDVAAEYRSESDFTASRGVAFDYVNEVAIMQLLPFVRETLLTMTTKVFPEPILLPVAQRGTLTFAPDEPDLDLIMVTPETLAEA
jgi:hypothetical protein